MLGVKGKLGNLPASAGELAPKVGRIVDRTVVNRPRDPGEVVSDERLLANYVSGDVSGLDTLVERYASELFQLLKRYVRDPSAADDLVQETFIQVHHAAATFDASRRFRPWLFTIAVNKARDYLRGRTRKREVPLGTNPTAGEEEAGSFLKFLADEGPSPSEGMETQERRQLVRDVIQTMPDALREILVLGYFHRFPYRELADVLDIPLGTVKSRLHAAVSFFAKAFREVEAQRAKRESRGAAKHESD